MQIVLLINISCSEGLLGDNVVKLFLRDQAIIISVSPLDHLLQFGVVDGLPELFGDSPKIFDRNEACFLVIEQVEYLSDVFAGILVRNSGSHQLQELLEIYLPRYI